MGKIKFSIITPSYNYGEYISVAIESVCAQTSSKIEVEHIIMDAGSTDDTIEVLKKYDHLKWISEPDKGMSDGINKGFLQATGDWMMWLNADDALLPNALEKIHTEIERNPKSDVIYGDCVFTDEKLEPVRQKFEHKFDPFVLFWSGCYIPSTSCFYRRNVIDDGELLDIEYKVCMDFEYYVRLHHKNYKFSYIPEPLAYFRWHDTNTSSVMSVRRLAERRKVQRSYLNSKGKSWMKSTLVLNTMFQLARAKRVMRKALERGCGRSRERMGW